MKKEEKTNRGYAGIKSAILYTDKTPKQIEHAVRRGYLRVRIALDGTQSFSYDDLDDYMNGSGAKEEKNEGTK
jgi:hypothetical protein